MIVKLETYHKYVNYWNNYNDTVKLNMIAAIQKSATSAWVGFSESVVLYAIYLKDGEKVYTNLAGFRKVMKASRLHNITFQVK